MALNYPGPYELRFKYSVTAGSLLLNHQHRVNVILSSDPPAGTPFSSINCIPADLVPFQLDTAVDAYVVELAKHYNNAYALINNVELWKYTPGSFEASFVSVYDIGVLGSSASAVNACQESRFTFRTAEGGTLMVVLAETVFSDKSAPIGYATLNAQEKALVDFILGASTGFHIGRDTSRPVSFNQLFRGTNEATFKRRFRTS